MSKISALFAYGSLMFAPVWQRVTGLSRAGVPASLEGFARHAVRGETYPALLADPDGRVDGRLYADLSDAVLAMLDRFEGPDYRRIQVSVSLTEGGSAVPAFVYLYIKPDQAQAEHWDVAAFEREGMSRFMREYCGFEGTAGRNG